MALPSIASVNTAASTVEGIIADAQNPAALRQVARELFEQYRQAFNRAVASAEALVFADATRADLTAFFAAEGADVAVDGFFTVADADDTTDNALAAAKGSAVANKDMFERTGAASVSYVGAYDASFSTMDAAIDG
jgi:hypothetical protein